MNPTDTNPEAFKSLIVGKYPDGVSSDGTRYADMPAQDLTQRIVSKYPDGVTNDGRKYSDFLQAPAPTPPPQQGLLSRIGGLFNKATELLPAPLSMLAHPMNAINSTVDAFKGGIDQAKSGYQQAQTATNPLQKTEAGLQTAAGGVNALFSPIAPLLAPVSKGINAVADKLSETPLIKGAAGNQVIGPGGAATYVPNEGADRVPQDINNITTLLPFAAGGGESSGILNKARAARQESGISSVAKDWKAPAEAPTATFNNARAVLDKSPDTPRFLAEQKLDPNAHIEQGRFSTEDAAQALRDTAGTMSHDTLRPSLEAADKTLPRTPIRDITNAAIEEARSQHSDTALSHEQIISNIQKESAALARKYPDGMSLTDMHDNKITYAKNGGYSPIKSALDNNTASANRSLGSALGKMVESKAPSDVPVGEFNKYLQKYYKAADYLDALHTKKAPYSTGKYIANRAASVAGAAIGHGLGGGILGGVGGYMIGGALEHAVENIPNPLRAAFLRKLQIEKPAAYVKVQKYLDVQNQNPVRRSAEVSAQPISIASKSSIMEMGNYKLGKNPVTGRVEPTGQYRAPRVNFYSNKPTIKPLLSKDNQVIPKNLQSLATEAKKYKSAEEFVKAQPTVYHGSPVELKNFHNKSGVFFTDSLEDASGFGGNPDHVYEGYLNFKNPLIIDAKGAKWDELDTKYGKSTREIIGNAQKDKYDGVVFKNIVDNIGDTADWGGHSTISYAYKPRDAFLNESQLTDLYNKTNKKP